MLALRWGMGMPNNAYWIAAAAYRSRRERIAPPHSESKPSASKPASPESEAEQKCAEFKKHIAGAPDLDLGEPEIHANSLNISSGDNKYLFTIHYSKGNQGWHWYLNDEVSFAKLGSVQAMYAASKRATFAEIADLARSVRDECAALRNKEYERTAEKDRQWREAREKAKKL